MERWNGSWNEVFGKPMTETQQLKQQIEFLRKELAAIRADVTIILHTMEEEKQWQEKKQTQKDDILKLTQY